ncbi:MAG: (2Fe-2S)-binding protein [Novosphingobium sp.]
MYVCICNAIRQSELRTAARNTDHDVESIYRSLGRPPQCRQCIEDAQVVIEDERRARRLDVCVA